MTKLSKHPDWLSASDLFALALPGLGESRGSVLRKSQREGWRSRMASGPGGKRYEFHVRSLPRPVLEAYAERLLGQDVVVPLKQVKDGFSAGLKNFQREVMEARAVILTEIDSLIATGFGRSNAIAQFIKLAMKGELSDYLMQKLRIANARSGFKNKSESMKRTISRSTLYLWIKERAERGISVLAPKSVFRSPYVPAWALAVMKLYGQPQKPSLAYVLEVLPDVLGTGIRVPSYSQVRRFLKRLSTQTRNHGRIGHQKLKSMKAYVQRDVADLWPGAVYAADGHRFDAEVAHPRHGRPFRPEITSVIDVYSRKVVGWSIALEEDTWGVLDAARHSFETNGLPDIWYVDNGRGFNNKNWDDELTGFMARLGITKKNSLPYNSQARGVIERLHQSLWVRSAKTLSSFIGKDMDDEAKRRHYKLTCQDINKYSKSANVMSWTDFMDWAGEQVKAYNKRPHSFLPKIRDRETFKRRHQTPEEVWKQGINEKDEPSSLSQAQQEDVYRPYVKRRTNRALVNLFGNRYFSRELEAYHGEDVMVGYDIHDASQVWVRDLEQRLICIAKFEGNKQSFFPVEVARKAHDDRLSRSLKQIDQKRDLLVQEKEEAAFGVNLKSVNALENAEDDLTVQSELTEAFLEKLHVPLVETDKDRPIFANTGDWIRWIINHPTTLTDDDKAQLHSLVHQSSFQLLLETLDIELSTIEELLS